MKRRIKRILAALTVVAMLTMLMLTAVTPALAEGGLAVTATTYPLYDLARNVGGEYVEAVYAPDAEDAEGSRVVLCMSDELEVPEGAWMIRATNGLELIDGDTDVLTVPVYNILCASALMEALQEIDPAHADTYEANYEAYTTALIAVDSEFLTAVKSDMKISCEDGSMAYFAKEYGVEYAPDAADAIVLRTYNHPAEEDMDTPYIDLMRRNVEALAQ